MNNVQTFELSKPVTNKSVVVTARIRQLDAYHIALIFENAAHCDMVLDVTDTDPDLWSGLQNAINSHLVSSNE